MKNVVLLSLLFFTIFHTFSMEYKRTEAGRWGGVTSSLSSIRKNTLNLAAHTVQYVAPLLLPYAGATEAEAPDVFTPPPMSRLEKTLAYSAPLAIIGGLFVVLVVGRFGCVCCCNASGHETAITNIKPVHHCKHGKSEQKVQKSFSLSASSSVVDSSTSDSDSSDASDEDSDIEQGQKKKGV